MDPQSSVPTPTPTPVPAPAAPAPLPTPKSQVRTPFIIALVLSFVAAGAITVLFKYFPLQPSAPQPSQPPIAYTAPTPTPAPLTLTLTSPKDGELAVNSEIIVEGVTAPDTTVVIFTEDDETTVESDSTGKFSTTVTLSAGINTLVITAFSDNGEEKGLSIDIVYDA